MPRKQLTAEDDFIVGESVMMDFSIGAFFFLLFFIALSVTYPDLPSKQKAYNKSVLLVLIPAITFTLKGIINKKIIKVNKEGIYQYSKLVTNWDNYKQAYVTQAEIVGSIQDNFVLIVEYYKEGEDGYFVRKIQLTNTQNKSEEEVIEAINFFFSLPK